MLGSTDIQQDPIAIYREWLGSLPAAELVVVRAGGRRYVVRAWLDEINNRAGAGQTTTAAPPATRPWLDEINSPQAPTAQPATSGRSNERGWLDEWVPENDRPGPTATQGGASARPNERGWLDEWVPENDRSGANAAQNPPPRPANVRTWLDEIETPTAQPAGVISRGGANEVDFATPQGRVRVWLPDDMAAGDTITGTVVAEPRGENENQRRTAGDTLEGMVIDVNGAQSRVSAGRFSLTVPPALTEVTIDLLDGRGRRLERSRLNLPPVPETRPEQVVPPRIGQAGRPLEINGPFDGNMDNTNVSIGGRPAEVIAESPRQAVVWTPPEPAANTNITVTEAGQTTQAPYSNLRIDLSAPRTNLQRGEQTQVHVQVSGLEGIAGPVNIRLEASSSVQMAGGNVQTIAIAPSAVGPGGVYQTDRPLQATQSGPFTVTASLAPSPPP